MMNWDLFAVKQHMFDAESDETLMDMLSAIAHWVKDNKAENRVMSIQVYQDENEFGDYRWLAKVEH